jgi:hypothetical protein
MIKYEYKEVFIHDNFTDECNKLGKLGWELCAINHPGMGSSECEAYFKRPLADTEYVRITADNMVRMSREEILSMIKLNATQISVVNELIDKERKDEVKYYNETWHKIVEQRKQQEK